MISEEINLKTVSSESDLQLWKDVNKLKNSENIIFHEPDLRSTVEEKNLRQAKCLDIQCL